ncbi:DUF3224 domain-containing protein [Streptomyces incarnatus]
MEKCFGAEGDGGNGRDGGVVGRSATLFTAAFDRTTGVGTYVAMESFEGSLSGRAGSFNFVHSAATTSGSDRTAEFLTTVRGRIASGSTTSCRQPDDGHGVRRPTDRRPRRARAHVPSDGTGVAWWPVATEESSPTRPSIRHYLRGNRAARPGAAQ